MSVGCCRGVQFVATDTLTIDDMIFCIQNEWYESAVIGIKAVYEDYTDLCLMQFALCFCVENT